MMDKKRMAIIGVGNRARSLIKASIATGEVNFVAYAEDQDDSIAKDLLRDAKSYNNWQQLFDEQELDAVIISTPNHLHTEIALEALDKGLHILCEKPLAHTLEDCKKIIDKSKKSSSVFQVGVELRHAPMMLDIKEMIEKSLIGQPKMIWCHEFRPPFRPGVNFWRHEKETSGGSLLEKNCHHFDLFNWFSHSRPVKVFAKGSNDTIYPNKTILDRAWVIVEYENGLQANLGLCLFHPFHRLEIGIIGTNGSIEYDSRKEIVTVSKKMKESIHYYKVDSSGVDNGEFDHPGEVEQIRAFLNSINTGNQAEVSSEVILWSHIISFAAEKSVQIGKQVIIQEDGTLVHSD